MSSKSDAEISTRNWFKDSTNHYSTLSANPNMIPRRQLTTNNTVASITPGTNSTSMLVNTYFFSFACYSNHNVPFLNPTQDAFQVASYVRELHRINLWPVNPQNQNLSAVIEAFNKFEDKDISQALGFGIFGKSPHCHACALDTRTKIAALMSKLMDDCRGLCLDCLDKGSRDQECRVKHD